MVDRNSTNDNGWSKAEEDWINSLPIDDFLDLLDFTKYGVESDKDEEKLKKLRESYAKSCKKR